MIERLVPWKQDLTDFVKAGGSQPSDEELRHAMMKMLPAGLSQEMMSKACAQLTSDDLEDWVRTQDEFQQDYGMPRKGVHLTQLGAPSSSQIPLTEQDVADGFTYEEEELDAETLALMSPAEVNAFYKARGQRTWQQQGRRNGQPFGGGQRKPTGGRPPPSSPSGPSNFKPRCYNCGKEGHRAQDCREAKRELKDRPCIRCGQLGHFIKDCKQKAPTRSVNLIDEQQQLPAILDAPRVQRVLCMQVDGSEPIVRGRRILPPGVPQPELPTLGDFVVDRRRQGEEKKRQKLKLMKAVKLWYLRLGVTMWRFGRICIRPNFRRNSFRLQWPCPRLRTSTRRPGTSTPSYIAAGRRRGSRSPEANL